MLLGRFPLAEAEVHGGEAADGLARRRPAIDLDRDREGRLQLLDRLVRLAEQEAEAAEVVQQPTDGPLVVELLEEVLGPLGVVAREHPVAGALGDERGLEVRVRHLARGRRRPAASSSACSTSSRAASKSRWRRWQRERQW